jgi:hypothetical protein
LESAVLAPRDNIKSVPILQLALLISFLAVIQIRTCGTNDTKGTSRSSASATVALPISGMKLKLLIIIITIYNWQST